mmetsp:Transcript_23197/g.11190  ORF Transcript_23197/g.11190 Transcript_23197/m.11190 type:complete len:107 (-) Transcript_23197:33-353(-)
MEKYASKVLKVLDPNNNYIEFTLYREACFHNGVGYVKDLTRLGRPIQDILIIDNSPNSYCLQPENALPISSWYDNANDMELTNLLPILEYLANCSNTIQELSKFQE